MELEGSESRFRLPLKSWTVLTCVRCDVQLYFIVMVGFLNAVSSGFDGSLMGGINAMDQYLDYVRDHLIPGSQS